MSSCSSSSRPRRWPSSPLVAARARRGAGSSAARSRRLAARPAGARGRERRPDDRLAAGPGDRSRAGRLALGLARVPQPGGPASRSRCCSRCAQIEPGRRSLARAGLEAPRRRRRRRRAAVAARPLARRGLPRASLHHRRPGERPVPRRMVAPGPLARAAGRARRCSSWPGRRGSSRRRGRWSSCWPSSASALPAAAPARAHARDDAPGACRWRSRSLAVTAAWTRWSPEAAAQLLVSGSLVAVAALAAVAGRSAPAARRALPGGDGHLSPFL